MGIMDILLGQNPNKKKVEEKKVEVVKVDDTTEKALAFYKDMLKQGRHKFALGILGITKEQFDNIKKASTKEKEEKNSLKKELLALMDKLLEENKAIVLEINSENEGKLRKKLQDVKDNSLDSKVSIARVAFTALILIRKRLQ